MKKFLKELLNKRLNNEKGLTLIELLAVIVILAIIAAIAVPAIGNIIENSRYNAVKADAINILNASNLYFVDNPGDQLITIGELETEGYLENPGAIANGTIANVGTIHLYASVEVNNQTVIFTSATEPTAAPAAIPTNAATIEFINGDTVNGADLTDNHVVGTVPTT